MTSSNTLRPGGGSLFPPIAASIIVPCKGRLNHLKQTLPRIVLQVGVVYEVIIVEYGDPDLHKEGPDIVNNLHCSPHCVAITIASVPDNVEEFNLSRARNIGGVLADAEVLVFLDADAIVGEKFLYDLAAPVACGTAGFVSPDWKTNPETKDNRGVGVCAVHAEAFERARGFDEGMQGWGYEDSDFLSRVELYLMRLKRGGIATCSAEHITFINHDDDLRVANYSTKDKRKSKKFNKAHSLDRKSTGMPVNPHGYGISENTLLFERMLYEPKSKAG